MPPISIMVKPASSLCNLRCKYCFYSDVSDTREVRSFGIMNESTADNLIKKALQFADGENISFTFQGGEPLLAGLPFYHHFLNKLNAENQKNSKVFLSIQTNGTLINDAWAKFFRANNILVGLSLDGDFNNNGFRVDENGKNAFHKVIAAAEKLKKHNVDFNILTVLTGRCADNIDDIYSFFKKMDFKYLQFIPCLRPFGDKSENELFMTSKQYENFLIKCFQHYADDFSSGTYTSIRYFDNLVRLYLRQSPEQCGMCGYCSRQFVAEGNGNIYPCDFYCTDEWLLGNINTDDFETLANSDTAMRFLKESLDIDEKCKKCEYYALCRGGGCKRNRQDRDYCDAYKKFFNECLKNFCVFDKLR